MLRAIGVPVGIGVVLGLVGVIVGVAVGHWQTISNVMTVIGLLSFVMLLFGAPAKSAGRRWDGFGSRHVREQNRAQGLRFGVNCVLVGLPILIISIVMYFVHP